MKKNRKRLHSVTISVLRGPVDIVDTLSKMMGGALFRGTPFPTSLCAEIAIHQWSNIMADLRTVLFW